MWSLAMETLFASCECEVRRPIVLSERRVMLSRQCLTKLYIAMAKTDFEKVFYLARVSLGRSKAAISAIPSPQTRPGPLKSLSCALLLP